MGAGIVVGGSGFIGRHVTAALLDAGQSVAAPSHSDFDIARETPPPLAASSPAPHRRELRGLARDSRVDNLEP